PPSLPDALPIFAAKPPPSRHEHHPHPEETLTTPARRTYLMCPPTYFDVTYAINPWMDTSEPVDRERALQQWSTLRQTYLDLGHAVELLEPVPGLPDMVFAANGALTIDDV